MGEAYKVLQSIGESDDAAPTPVTTVGIKGNMTFILMSKPVGMPL